MLQKINSFILVFGLIYLIQNYTIGQFSVFDDLYIIKPILLKEVLFVISSIIFTLKCFKWKFKSNKCQSA